MNFIRTNTFFDKSQRHRNIEFYFWYFLVINLCVTYLFKFTYFLRTFCGAECFILVMRSLLPLWNFFIYRYTQDMLHIKNKLPKIYDMPLNMPSENGYLAVSFIKRNLVFSYCNTVLNLKKIMSKERKNKLKTLHLNFPPQHLSVHFVHKVFHLILKLNNEVVKKTISQIHGEMVRGSIMPTLPKNFTSLTFYALNCLSSCLFIKKKKKNIQL